MATNRELASLVSRGQSSTSGYASRAYFAALSLAILDVALYRVDIAPNAPLLLEGTRVRAVQVGTSRAPIIDSTSCPAHLLMLLGALAGVARGAQALATRDDARAMAEAERDAESTSSGLLDRLRSRMMGVEGLKDASTLSEDEQMVSSVALGIQKLGMGECSRLPPTYNRC